MTPLGIESAQCLKQLRHRAPPGNWKEVQGSGRGLIWVPFVICLDGRGKTTEKVKKDIRRLRRNSNLISPEY